MARALRESVDLVGATAAQENIDCGFRKGGTLTLALSDVQRRRILARKDIGVHGHAEAGEWLDAAAAGDRMEHP